MSNKKIKYFTFAILLLSSFLFTGCIPQNEHIGKPEAHSYKNSSYGYDGGYYDRDYYYR